MKILICAFDYPPVGGGRSFRMSTYSRHWAEMGHDVTVVNSGTHLWNSDNNDYDQFKLLEKKLKIVVVSAGFRNKSWNKFKPLALIFRAFMSAAVIPDFSKLWAIKVKRKIRRGNINSDFDVLITSGPPHGVHSIGLSFPKRDVFWFADFRDPFVDNRNYKAKSSLHHKLNLKYEEAIMQRANQIVLNTAGNFNRVKTRYPWVESKCSVIQNGFDPIDHFNVTLSSTEEDGFFTIGYLGTIRDYRGILRLLEYMKDESPLVFSKIKIIHIGTLQFKGRIIDELASQGQSVFLGFYPKSEALNILRSTCQLGLVLLPDDNESGRTVPGKTYQYLAEGIPILSVAPEGDLLDLTRLSNGFGISYDNFSEDANAFIQMVVKYLENEITLSRADSELVQRFSVSTLASKWLDLYDKSMS